MKNEAKWESDEIKVKGDKFQIMNKDRMMLNLEWSIIELL